MYGKTKNYSSTRIQNRVEEGCMHVYSPLFCSYPIPTHHIIETIFHYITSTSS